VNRKGELVPTTYRFKIDTEHEPNSIPRILSGDAFESIEPMAIAWLFNRVWRDSNSGKKATAVKLAVWICRKLGMPVFTAVALCSLMDG
jgi:hypothetical protein